MDVQKLLEYCFERLVDSRDEVVITHRETPEKNIYEVRVAPTDLAKVIGREGRTFKSLRALINIPNQSVQNDLVVDTAN